MAVLLAALSSVAFGSGDLVGGIAIRRSGRPDAAVATASISSVVAAVICGLALLVAPPDRLTGNDVAWAAAAGLIMTVTRPLLYLGMARGPVTVFAPGYGLAAITLPACSHGGGRGAARMHTPSTDAVFREKKCVFRAPTRA